MRKASIGVGLVFLLTVGVQPPAPAYAQHEASELSAIGIAGLVVFDIVTAPGSAARYNKSQLQLSPTVNLHDASPGLALRFFFNRARPLDAGYVKRYTPPVPHFPKKEKRKSPSTAFMLSLGSTFAPILLGFGLGVNEDLRATQFMFSGALVLGPSVGYWYAEQYGRGWLTAGLRAVLMAILLHSFNSSYS